MHDPANIPSNSRMQILEDDSFGRELLSKETNSLTTCPTRCGNDADEQLLHKMELYLYCYF